MTLTRNAKRSLRMQLARGKPQGIPVVAKLFATLVLVLFGVCIFGMRSLISRQPQKQVPGNLAPALRSGFGAHAYTKASTKRTTPLVVASVHTASVGAWAGVGVGGGLR